MVQGRRQGMVWQVTAGVLVGGILAMASLAFPQISDLRKQQEAQEGTGATVVIDDAPMVLIPKGEFWMGVDGSIGLEDEQPRHEVWTNEFYIDKFEVTTERYANFLAAAPRTAPLFWRTVDLELHANRPVIGVTWYDAQAFCLWAGKRLPTEAEWEKAARGSDERRYPWGNQSPNSDLANFAVGARFSYSQALMPVGSYKKAKSPYGVMDMSGNVWEWVSDWYDGRYYERSPVFNPTGPEQGELKVLRGGSWSELPSYLLTYGRFKLPADTRNSFTGFRCAQSRLTGKEG